MRTVYCVVQGEIVSRVPFCRRTCCSWCDKGEESEVGRVEGTEKGEGREEEGTPTQTYILAFRSLISVAHCQSRSSPEKRDRSSSPMDMETSDEDDEDGQITREEQEEERERRILGKHNPEEEKITVLDLEKIRLTRDALAKNCLSTWFEDYVKGSS